MRFVIFLRGTGSVWALPLEGHRTPVPLIESSSSVDEPHVSPDGRWLAYSGNDIGQWEVYLQPFVRPGGRVRVSTSGGSQAHWRGDGGELFYLALDNTMMSVRTANPASLGAPRRLFRLRLVVRPVYDQYAVTADSQRFMVLDPEGQQATRLTVPTNWPALLKPDSHAAVLGVSAIRDARPSTCWSTEWKNLHGYTGLSPSGGCLSRSAVERSRVWSFDRRC